MSKQQFADELTIALRKPIKLGEEVEYREIKLTEPLAGQLRKAAKAGDSLDQLCELIHLVAGLPKAVVEKIPQRELNMANDFFGHFGEESPPTTDS